MKYEFTGEKKVVLGITLRRIRALVSFGLVVKGKVGGWIEKEDNLSQVSGDAWVYGNARVSGDASPEEIARLDVVREVVLKNPKRLHMADWHSNNWTPEHTPEEEHACGSVHCIAGWLQALSPDLAIRQMEPYEAGKKLAPASSHMFSVSDERAFLWLQNREYAKVADTPPAK